MHERQGQAGVPDRRPRETPGAGSDAGSGERATEHGRAHGALFPPDPSANDRDRRTWPARPELEAEVAAAGLASGHKHQAGSHLPAWPPTPRTALSSGSA